MRSRLMLIKKDEILSKLLAVFFQKQNIQMSFEYIFKRLKKITRIDDIIRIDQDIYDPLWLVVPQILIYKFGVQAFQDFQPAHWISDSFIFVHPVHCSIVGELKCYLNHQGIAVEEKDLELTEQVVSALYGGYEWYESYFKACQYLHSMGQTAKIIILHNINKKNIVDLIKYKNKNRNKYKKQIFISKYVLKTNLDGIVRSFHTPDCIQNVRQMIGLRFYNIARYKNV